MSRSIQLHTTQRRTRASSNEVHMQFFPPNVLVLSLRGYSISLSHSYWQSVVCFFVYYSISIIVVVDLLLLWWTIDFRKYLCVIRESRYDSLPVRCVCAQMEIYEQKPAAAAASEASEHGGVVVCGGGQHVDVITSIVWRSLCPLVTLVAFRTIALRLRTDGESSSQEARCDVYVSLAPHPLECRHAVALRSVYTSSVSAVALHAHSGAFAGRWWGVRTPPSAASNTPSPAQPRSQL